MKLKVMFEANDGALFYTQSEAEDYELDMSQLEYICERYFDGLESPKDCEYIQHDTDNVRIFKDMFFEFIADRYAEDEFYIHLFDNVKVGKGNIESVERLVNELCPKKVRDVYYRLLCTKSDGKEFSQPYYARYTSQAVSDGACFKEKE